MPSPFAEASSDEISLAFLAIVASAAGPTLDSESKLRRPSSGAIGVGGTHKGEKAPVAEPGLMKNLPSYSNASNLASHCCNISL